MKTSRNLGYSDLVVRIFKSTLTSVRISDILDVLVVAPDVSIMCINSSRAQSAGKLALGILM